MKISLDTSLSFPRLWNLLTSLLLLTPLILASDSDDNDHVILADIFDLHIPRDSMFRTSYLGGIMCSYPEDTYPLENITPYVDAVLQDSRPDGTPIVYSWNISLPNNPLQFGLQPLIGPSRLAPNGTFQTFVNLGELKTVMKILPLFLRQYNYTGKVQFGFWNNEQGNLLAGGIVATDDENGVLGCENPEIQTQVLTQSIDP